MTPSGCFEVPVPHRICDSVSIHATVLNSCTPFAWLTHQGRSGCWSARAVCLVVELVEELGKAQRERPALQGRGSKVLVSLEFFLLRCICFVFKCFTPHKCTGRVLTILSMCFSFKYPLRRLTEILPLKLNFRYKDLARGLVRLIVKRKASYADPNGPPPTDSVEAFMQFRKVNMHSCDWEDGDTTIRTTYYNCILLHL